jgi:hypothetical protein
MPEPFRVRITSDTRVIISAYLFPKNRAMITRVSSVIRPKGSDLIFDHPYNADYLRLVLRVEWPDDGAQINHICMPPLGDVTQRSARPEPTVAVNAEAHRHCGRICRPGSCAYAQVPDRNAVEVPVALQLVTESSAVLVRCRYRSAPSPGPSRPSRVLRSAAVSNSASGPVFGVELKLAAVAEHRGRTAHCRSRPWRTAEPDDLGGGLLGTRATVLGGSRPRRVKGRR